MEEVTFLDSQGNQILGTVSISQQSGPVVIMSHGFSSSKESTIYVALQNELNEAGIGTLRYDYYGHGQLYCKDARYTVARDVTLTKCVDSIQSAISFVRSKGDYDIGLFGSSFGGLISIIATSQDSAIRALFLKSPVTEPIEFWRQRLGDRGIEKWEQEGIMHYDECGENYELNFGFWEDLKTYDTVKMATNIMCPVGMVHGDRDVVVPILQSQNLAKIIDTEVNVVQGANHNYIDPAQYDEMRRLIIDFLVEKLSPYSYVV